MGPLVPVVAGMTHRIDPNPCRTGWAPCPSIATGGHVCERGAGLAGRCRCGMCGATHRAAPANADRAQIAALGADADERRANPPPFLFARVVRPEPARGHFAD